MRRSIESRVRKLELTVQSHARPAVVFRYGCVKRLAEDSLGERHIAIATSAVTAAPHVEQCEFEERFGPAGERDDFGFFVYLCSEDENGNES